MVMSLMRCNLVVYFTVLYFFRDHNALSSIKVENLLQCGNIAEIKLRIQKQNSKIEWSPGGRVRRLVLVRVG